MYQEKGKTLIKKRPGEAHIKKMPHLKERVNFDGSLSRGTQGPLCPLASGPQPSDGALVAGDVLLVLPLELVHEVGHHPVVEVLSAQVSVASSGFDLFDYKALRIEF